MVAVLAGLMVAVPGPPPTRAPGGRYRPPTTNQPAPTTTSGSTRAWPRDTDPPWITFEDAAHLNPWGDPVDEKPGHPETSPAPART